MFTYTKAVKSHHLWTLYICSFHFLLLANTIKCNVRLDLKRFSTQVYKYWRYWLYCCYYAIFYVSCLYFSIDTGSAQKPCNSREQKILYNKVWCKYSFSRLVFLWIFMLKNHGVLCFHYLQIKKSSNYSTFV